MTNVWGALRRSLLLAAVFLLAQPAWADIAPLPYPVSSMTPASGSITTGGTSQQVLAANPGRKVFCVENPSSATEDLFFDFGRAASVTTSMDVPIGQMICMGGALIYQGAIQVNAATTGHAFIVYEGQ